MNLRCNVKLLPKSGIAVVRALMLFMNENKLHIHLLSVTGVLNFGYSGLVCTYMMHNLTVDLHLCLLLSIFPISLWEFHVQYVLDIV